MVAVAKRLRSQTREELTKIAPFAVVADWCDCGIVAIPVGAIALDRGDGLMHRRHQCGDQPKDDQ